MGTKADIEFSDYYEKARFELTRKINFFLSIVFPFLIVSLYIFDQMAYIPSIIGWLASIGMLILMKRTGHYFAAALIFSLLGTTLCLITLLTIPQSFHLVDTLWMIICVLYTYFSLGKLWGNLILAINIGGLIWFIIMVLNISIELVNPLSTGELISLALNAAICGVIIAYLAYQFIETTRFAESAYMKLNTELQIRNEAVIAQNEEKTVMLREIHHRVKNNLQVITSLLRLQAREARDERSIELFKDSTNRVVAMALIHEKMYQTRDLAKINLEEYLRTLLNDLIESYSIEIPIDADIHSNVEMITNKSLVPLALLFNELVSNSLKHAFTRADDGRIRIDIQRMQGKIVLRYEDNGIWRERQKDTSFGLELIESLTEQMDGSYTRKLDQGTSYEFILPDNL